ncbi:MAG TPA: hypothetical protein PLS53_16705 [Thermoanaerobaculaceae bacterium]|nr:hypothetical protein [Thermoanaerobaculaceae bacterium]HPS79802.1 hypothetical protein [Thermoanaerobaculaceae bacterium]
MRMRTSRRGSGQALDALDVLVMGRDVRAGQLDPEVARQRLLDSLPVWAEHARVNPAWWADLIANRGAVQRLAALIGVDLPPDLAEPLPPFC